MIRYVLSPLLTKPLPVYQHATVLRETLVLTSCIQPFVPGTFVIPEPTAAEDADAVIDAGAQASNLHAARARTQLAQALENIECVLAAANVGASLATAVHVSVFLDHHDRDRDAASAALDELLKGKRNILPSATAADGSSLAFVPPHCEFVGVRVIPRGCNVGVAVVALSANAYRSHVAAHSVHGQSASIISIKEEKAPNSCLWFPEPRVADQELPTLNSLLSHLASASSGSPSATALSTVPAPAYEFQPLVRALGSGVIEVRCVLPICIADAGATATADGQTAPRRRVASELTAAQQAALCLDEYAD
jgi:enamine deaminase RidA (YjgF/YER057c/UK114 family)